MKRKKNKDTQPILHYRDIKHKCSECSIVSYSVDKSYKYNNYYCIDCLTTKILTDSIKENSAKEN